MTLMMLMLATAVINGLPVRDRDEFLGPSYVRLPLIVVLVMVVDVVPRVFAQRPAVREIRGAAGCVVRSRWTMPGVAAITAGMTSFYLAYVAYRNLKGFLPLLRDRLTDSALVNTDRWFADGSNPSDLLHEMLGTGITAEFLSVVYVSIMFTAALMAHLIRLPKPVRWLLWIYVPLTGLATVYFGWHYILDVPAGLAIGGLSVWLAAFATGRLRLPVRRRTVRTLQSSA